MNMRLDNSLYGSDLDGFESFCAKQRFVYAEDQFYWYVLCETTLFFTIVKTRLKYVIQFIGSVAS
jgi:hypothetical protein